MLPHTLARRFQGRVPAVFALDKLGFGAFLPVNVDGLDGQMPHCAGFFVNQRRRRRKNPDRVAVLPEIAPFRAVPVNLSRQQVGHLRTRRRGVVRMDDFLEAEPNEFLRPIAEKLGKCPVGIGQVAICIGQERRDERVLNHVANQRNIAVQTERPQPWFLLAGVGHRSRMQLFC